MDIFDKILEVISGLIILLVCIGGPIAMMTYATLTVVPQIFKKREQKRKTKSRR